MNHCDLGPRRCGACKTARYGWAHQQERKRWAPIVATGTVHCARCHGLINPGEPWDLDHLADGSRHPSHANENRAASVTTRRGRRLARGSGL